METIANELARIGEQMPRSSEIQQIKSLPNTPSRAEVTVLLVLINRARALNGWKMQDEATLEKRMLVWWDVLRQYRIPLEAYKELFDMAFDERQMKIADGKDVPVEAALLVSCWTRPHGLRAVIEQRRVEDGRTLTDTAASQCERCNGTGMELVFDLDGRVIAAKAGKQCEHLPITVSEGLWVHIQRRKEYARPTHIVENIGSL